MYSSYGKPEGCKRMGKKQYFEEKISNNSPKFLRALTVQSAHALYSKDKHTKCKGNYT